MSETWFTSDTHLGHELVAQKRGFDTVEEHDAHLAKMWDRVVQPDDDVWVLGDLAMNGWKQRLGWFGQRPGHKNLVLGNHDRAHPSQKNAHAHQVEFLRHFESVQSSASINRNGETLLLSHFPYNGEGSTRDVVKKDRYTQWRLRDEGLPLIHGHTHDPIQFRFSTRGSKMHHVGVDAWNLSPVRFHDLMNAHILSHL